VRAAVEAMRGRDDPPRVDHGAAAHDALPAFEGVVADLDVSHPGVLTGADRHRFTADDPIPARRAGR
jgi:hypothetical protein